MTLYNEFLEDFDLESVMIWAQMFFEDGSVSQGYRVAASIYFDDSYLQDVGRNILNDLNRSEGSMLIWGAGKIVKRDFKDSTACPSTELNS